MKVGRPSLFTPQLAERICEKIATTPRGLAFICVREPGFPDPATVNRWLIQNEEFRASYLHARQRQADLIFDECLTIIDTPVTGVETITKADGTVEKREGDMLGHRKLQVDTRMRMAGKLSPKKYGDRMELEHGGEVTVNTVTRKIVD